MINSKPDFKENASEENAFIEAFLGGKTIEEMLKEFSCLIMDIPDESVSGLNMHSKIKQILDFINGQYNPVMVKMWIFFIYKYSNKYIIDYLTTSNKDDWRMDPSFYIAVILIAQRRFFS